MDKGVLLPYFNKLELQERWKLKKYQKYTILMIELVFQLYNGKYWVDIKICLSKTIESISEKLIIQISVSCSVDHQIQFLSSQHMKVLKEHPWHLLQLEHISPSAQVPYLYWQDNNYHPSWLPQPCPYLEYFPPHISPGPLRQTVLPQESLVVL